MKKIYITPLARVIGTDETECLLQASRTPSPYSIRRTGEYPNSTDNTQNPKNGFSLGFGGFSIDVEDNEYKGEGDDSIEW